MTPEKIELKAVDLSNLREIVALSVREEQQGLAASNLSSLAEAWAAGASGCAALPFGLYAGGQPVGFVMFGYGSIPGDPDEPRVAPGNYLIWRFMIDRRHQGRGLGRAALRACLSYLRSRPCGAAELCWLSYSPENHAARALYASEGFVENGERCGGEVVAVAAL